MRKVQKDISPRMREVVVDWLVDVHHKFMMKSETLFRTIFLLDNYLSKVKIDRRALQLIGIQFLT